MPYSQVLRYNRIYSDNENVDKCCKDFEKCLMERNYNEKMICKQIWTDQKCSRNDFLQREKKQIP